LLEIHQDCCLCKWGAGPAQIAEPHPECHHKRVEFRVTVIDSWSGAHASALRAALRLTNESFAEFLGTATRTVANWNSTPEVTPRPELQRALDTTLERASETERSRFELLCGAIGTPPTEPASPVGWVIERRLMGLCTHPQPTTQPQGMGPTPLHQNAVDRLPGTLPEMAEQTHRKHDLTLAGGVTGIRSSFGRSRAARRQPSSCFGLGHRVQRLDRGTRNLEALCGSSDSGG
jgi:hypothetical protein